ncbi:hypothetical protein [Nocardia terpenica]|uniref:hypothetical protein n=1 Tax=Nocardia terpenica TaxID=455432 RepID=UPI001EEA6847|nr:hypothetical protein [Nocardia terpenica]
MHAWFGERAVVLEDSRGFPEGTEQYFEGRQIGPLVALTPAEAVAHFPSPFLAAAYGIDAPVSSVRTRALLGWSPTHPTLLADLEHGDYLTTSHAQLRH